jgi:hypothetical protein
MNVSRSGYKDARYVLGGVVVHREIMFQVISNPRLLIYTVSCIVAAVMHLSVVPGE